MSNLEKLRHRWGYLGTPLTWSIVSMLQGLASYARAELHASPEDAAEWAAGRFLEDSELTEIERRATHWRLHRASDENIRDQFWS